MRVRRAALEELEDELVEKRRRMRERCWRRALGDAVARPMPEHATDRYKWVALSNTTIGMLMATINSSIVLIALPDIFRGIHLNPLLPGNASYLLWMMMGFMVATAVLVVSFGRIGDMYGRVRMFNLGFAVFTACSILLSVTWMHGPAAALWLIAMRIGQGVGGALLMAQLGGDPDRRLPATTSAGWRSASTPSRPSPARSSGSCSAACSAPVDWRLVFLVSVPVGLFGTALGVLEARGARRAAPGEDRLVGQRDVRGRADPGAGRRSPTASSPTAATRWAGRTRATLAELFGGLALLGVFVVIELRTDGADVPARRCSGSARSLRAASRRCSPRSAAAG